MTRLDTRLDALRTAGRKALGGAVRPVSRLPDGIEHALARLGIDLRIAVQRPAHRCLREAQQLR